MVGNLQRSTQKTLPPLSEYARLTQLRDKLDDFLERFGSEADGWPAATLVTPMDISESDESLQLCLDLPGVDPEDLHIQLSGDQVTITGERKERQEKNAESFHRIERWTGRFSRSIRLPCRIDDEEQIDANYQDGVLSILVPKPEESKARRIEVKAN